MSALESLKIASPCSADWSAMNGTDQVRHCDQCSLNVFNISAMTRAEAEALIQEAEGRLCVRMYQRADGTVMTRDCPVGAARKRRRMAFFASVFTGLMGLAATATAFALRRPAQCPTGNPATTSTSLTSGLGDVEPFKTLATWFPSWFPQQTPPPQGQMLMGDVAFIPPPTPVPSGNSGSANSGNTSSTNNGSQP